MSLHADIVCLDHRVMRDQIVATQSYKNFEMQFHDPNWVEFINDYVAGGGLASDLIE